MSISLRRLHRLVVLLIAASTLGGIGVTQVVQAASPTAEQALKLSPVQKDVEYDIPAAADIPKCTIKAEKIDGQTGWVIRAPNGQILREFVDTNGDNIVDRWSYYKDGIEVYRDIDENFNGKADQYRWLNTAGTRWGIDRAEDGKIDSWKQISPEEVTAEVVLALRDKDSARFNRLLVNAAEAKALGLGAAKAKQLNEKLSAAPAAFIELMRKQKVVAANTQWTHFGGTRPGIVPTGVDGSTAEITAYENVVAMTETDGKDGQVSIGTLVKVGDGWRVIDAPSIPDPASKQVAEVYGFFFQAPNRTSDAGTSETAADGPTEKVQKMMDELSKLDEAVGHASSDAEQTRLNDRRAELLLQIIDEVGEKDKAQWVRQFADSMSAAAQTGSYPAGVEKLKTLGDKLDKNSDDVLVPYVKFRYLTADYGAKLQAHQIDFPKVQSEWLDNLEQFVKDYPKAADSADALLQLGMAQEFDGQDEKAKKYYHELLTDFATSNSAVKARGAINRLDSVGQVMQLRGKTVTGQVDDLSRYRGKYVLVHYWATWCEPCKTDFAELKELYAKYGKNLALVGINVDNNLADATDYLSKNKLPWVQLWEQGGLDGRLANEMGILTLPTMILLDDKGRVVNRNVHITELDNELKSVIK